MFGVNTKIGSDMQKNIFKHPMSVLEDRCRFIVLVLSMFSLSACGQAPEVIRPDNVPESAIWVGGEDGGFWSNCMQVEQAIRCQRFSQNGGYYSEQDFNLCASGSLSQLGLRWRPGMEPEINISQGLILVPVSPRAVFRNGALDEELTAELSKGYNLTERSDCIVDFVIVE